MSTPALSKSSCSKLCCTILSVVMGLILAPVAHGDVMLSATAEFDPTGGGNDNDPDTFTITNTSDTGVSITGITINLIGSLFFDTASGGSGASGSNPFVDTSTDDVGFESATVVDGGTELTAMFTAGEFETLESFVFTIDVDRGGGGGQNVNANQFADNGANISFTFAGPFTGSPLTSGPADFVQAGNVARADFQLDAQSNNGSSGSTPVPEPASTAIWLLLSLVGGGYWMRKRKVRAV